MTYGDIKQKLLETAEQLEGKTNFLHIGYRIEAREYSVGDIIEGVSRANLDREDEREFPEYGTEEYEELDELDGLCAYDLNIDLRTIDDIKNQLDTLFRGIDNVNHNVKYDGHIYVIGTNKHSNDFAEDDYEIIMPEPTVLAVIC